MFYGLAKESASGVVVREIRIAPSIQVWLFGVVGVHAFNEQFLSQINFYKYDTMVSKLGLVRSIGSFIFSPMYMKPAICSFPGSPPNVFSIFWL